MDIHNHRNLSLAAMYVHRMKKCSSRMMFCGEAHRMKLRCGNEAKSNLLWHPVLKRVNC